MLRNDEVDKGLKACIIMRVKVGCFVILQTNYVDVI